MAFYGCGPPGGRQELSLLHVGTLGPSSLQCGHFLVSISLEEHFPKVGNKNSKEKESFG